MTALNTDNPSCVELADLIACGDTDIITDAVVEATIYDSDGVGVTGQVWPLTLTYDAITTKYRGITSDTLGLTENATYTVNIIAKTGGGSVLGEWNIKVRATIRGTS